LGDSQGRRSDAAGRGRGELVLFMAGSCGGTERLRGGGRRRLRTTLTITAPGENRNGGPDPHPRSVAGARTRWPDRPGEGRRRPALAGLPGSGVERVRVVAAQHGLLLAG